MPPDAATTSTEAFLLGEMNAKLDMLVARSNEDRENAAKLTERVQKLEAWRWIQVGAAGTAGAIVSLLVKAAF